VLGSAAKRPALRDALAAVERENLADITRVFEVATEHGWVKKNFAAESVAAVWHGLVLGHYLPELAEGVLDPGDWAAAASEAMLHLMFDDLVGR